MRYTELRNENFKTYLQKIADRSCTLKVFFGKMVPYVGVALKGEGQALTDLEKKIIIPRVKAFFNQLSSCVGDHESVKDAEVARDLDARFADLFKSFIEESKTDIELAKMVASKGGVELEVAKKALAAAPPVGVLLTRVELFLTKNEFVKAIDYAEQIITNLLAEKNTRREAFKGKMNGLVGLKQYREAANCAKEAIAAGFSEKIFYKQVVILLRNNVIAAYSDKKISRNSDEGKMLQGLYEEICTSYMAALECGEALDGEDYKNMNLIIGEIELNSFVELSGLVSRAKELVATYFIATGIPRATQAKMDKAQAGLLSSCGLMRERSSGVRAGAGADGDDVAAAAASSRSDSAAEKPSLGR